MKIMIHLFLYSIFISALIFTGCKNPNQDEQSDTTGPDPALIKCWVNSFEEEGQDNVRIYRPCATHTFPVARYRDTFTLNENGDVEYSVLAENDAHTTQNGKWRYDGKNKKLTIMSPGNELVHEYEVVELGDDILKLRGN